MDRTSLHPLRPHGEKAVPSVRTENGHSYSALLGCDQRKDGHTVYDRHLFIFSGGSKDSGGQLVVERTASVIPFLGRYEHLTVRYDLHDRAVWCWWHPRPRPCFSPWLLKEMRHFQKCVDRVNLACQSGEGPAIEYIVWCSKVAGIYNLGGDLSLIMHWVEDGDSSALQEYAALCIDVLFANACGGESAVNTISVVAGDALGGGFEAALSSSLLVAERKARFGLPEVMFNLFPGMGAYSFLSRRLDPARAERMILTGTVYDASRLCEMGLVDSLVPDGRGEEAAVQQIRRHQRRRTAYRTVRKLREEMFPISYDELMRVGAIWAETAVQLREKDLRVMKRLLKAQDLVNERHDRTFPFQQEGS